MAQVITNTFFDDCEAIQNVDGIPVLDFDAVVDRSKELGDRYTSDTAAYLNVANAEKYGLSKRLLRGIPNSLLGCMLSSKRNKFSTTFNSILHADPENPAVSDTVAGVFVSPVASFAISAFTTFEPENGVDIATIAIDRA